MDQKFKLVYNIAMDDLLPICKARGNDPDLPLATMPILSKKLWGLQKGRLTVIGARTSQGKSSFVGQVAYDLASQGKEVLFLSLEMSKEEMVERLFCNLMQVDNIDFRANFNKYEESFGAFTKKIYNIPLGFSDCIGRNWDEIDDMLTEMPIKPQVVILDYINAISGKKRTKKESIDDYILHFREMAVKHSYAGVLCAQINRDSDKSSDKTPKMWQLKETGCLEECADVVMLLYWPGKEEEHQDSYVYEIHIAKNRMGRTGATKLKWYPQYCKFTDLNATLAAIKEKQELIDELNRMVL